jgi:hypothetical protein
LKTYFHSNEPALRVFTLDLLQFDLANYNRNDYILSMNSRQSGIELSSKIDPNKIIHCLKAKLIHNSLDCPASRAMQFFCISTILLLTPKQSGFSFAPGRVRESAQTAGSARVNEKTTANPRTWPLIGGHLAPQGDGSQDLRCFFRAGRRIVRARFFWYF